MATETGKVDVEELAKHNKQWPQWLAVTSASLSYFTAGICFAWSSPSLAILQSDKSPFSVNNTESSWIAAFLPIGCAVGPFVGSLLSRSIGPKNTTILTSFPYLIGFLLIILADSPTWLYYSRFLSGFAVGFGQTTTPIYIAELAENHNRGALMSFFTFSMGIGALFITFLGPYFTIRAMAMISSIFPILVLMTMPMMPDSPYYLVKIGDEPKAQKAIEWFRRQTSAAVVQDEMKTIKTVTSESIGLIESFKLLTKKPNPRALSIIFVLFMLQSFCGAIVVLFFQEQIYTKTGIPIPPEIAVMITLVVSNISGFVSVLFVDNWGRKPLLLLSSVGCAMSTATIGFYIYISTQFDLDNYAFVNWIPVIALNTLQIFFYLGLSPVPTTILGEIFCTNVKEIAFCLGFVVAAVAGFIITKLYQIIGDSLGTHVVFFGMSVITFIFLFIMIMITPETKEKSFLEIQSILKENKLKKEESISKYTIKVVE